MADYSFLAGLGSGLSELGNQLTRREMLKLAQEEKDLAAKRQAEQDALARAQAVGAEAKGLRSENFDLGVRSGDKSPQAFNAILKSRGLQTPGLPEDMQVAARESYTAPVSGDTYFRDPGMAPNAIKAEQVEQARIQRETLARMAADNRLALEGIEQKALDSRWDRTSKNVETTVGGQNYRHDNLSADTKYRVDNPAPRGGAGGGGQQPILRAPTEAQAKDAKYYDMMEKAVPVLDQLAPHVRGDRISAALRLPEMIANRGLTKEEQMYLRAARDFATGVYRPETGASAKPSEVLDVYNRYLTVGGDLPELTRAKLEARAAKLATQKNAALPAIRYYQSQQGIVPELPKMGSGASYTEQLRAKAGGRP